MEPKTSRDQEQQLGVAAIDSEHHLQLRLVAVLREAVQHRRDHAVLAEILRRVEETTRLHFTSEELLMRRDGYDHHALHVEEHRKALDRLSALRLQLDADPAVDLRPAIGWFEEWLGDHIRGMDRRFAESVRRGAPGVS